ncbi:hypothetical protein ACVI1L_004103 [Bradyrhizobium sp. USDA 4516]
MTLAILLAVEALAVQHGDLALGAADRVVNQVELDLELLALFDLRTVGLEQRVGLGDFAGDRRIDAVAGALCRGCGHLGADRAKLGHDLAMHRTEIGAARNIRLRHHNLAHRLLDTKTLALH